MAQPAKQLMDVFNSFATDYKKTGQFDKGFVFDSAESAVNNVMHGKTITDILPLVRNVLTSSAELDFLTKAEKEAYNEAIELVDEFAKDYN